MPKFTITNISAEMKKPRNIFLNEIGKKLEPGDQCTSNRVTDGTRSLEAQGVLQIVGAEDETLASASTAADEKAAAEKAAAEKAAAEKAAAEKAAAEEPPAEEPPAEEPPAEEPSSGKRTGKRKKSGE